MKLRTLITTLVLIAGFLATATKGNADFVGSLDGSMIQRLLQDASNGYSGIPVTKDDSLSDENGDWYDLNSPPQGFSRCSISVSKPDNQGSELCTFYSSGDGSGAFQAESGAESALRAALPGWEFHTPNSSSNTLAALKAVDPSNANRSVRVSARKISASLYTAGIAVDSGVQAHLSFP